MADQVIRAARLFLDGGDAPLIDHMVRVGPGIRPAASIRPPAAADADLIPGLSCFWRQGCDKPEIGII